jgi:hypothetical protein
MYHQLSNSGLTVSPLSHHALGLKFFIDLVVLVLSGICHCSFAPLLGLSGEGGQYDRHRPSEFFSALRRHLPG